MPLSSPWSRFLSDTRIGSQRQSAGIPSRSEFHKDYDRIIFSSAFRRLSDKTQVVPFPDSDYTRRRLTHSLEVSCVGRSLATIVYDFVQDEIGRSVTQGDFEAIVAAACLAHDIGNPPFGHFGETAIQEWAETFLRAPRFDDWSAAEKTDLTAFEGNAQSFRVLTRLQMSNRIGGMRLTAATLGALVKYPRPSVVEGKSVYAKHGHVQDDAAFFRDTFETVGRTADRHGQFHRHPLALLSEAADDICYAIIDLEDGCKSGLVELNAALEIFEALRSGSTGDAKMPASERIAMGRAIVINELVQQCASVFRTHLQSVLDGSFAGSLVRQCPSADEYANAKRLARERVFNSDRVLEVEATGYRAIQGLLNIVVPAAVAANPNGYDRHVLKLTRLPLSDTMTDYQRILACTDNVSGMTDRYCVDLFRKLSGDAGW